MEKIIVILGPTATGKTTLAVKLAKKFHGEIISADSRAIYRGLSIGTAKPRGKWKTNTIDGRQLCLFLYKNIPHHIVDFLSPKKSFSAHDFAIKSKKLIRSIDLPIVTGGTGFWIDALVNNTALGNTSPNQDLRKKLAKKSLGQLFGQLKKLDPNRASTIQRSNKRRLIRAIEIAVNILRVKRSGIEKFSTGLSADKQAQTINYHTLYLGINFPNTTIKKRIHKRFLLWLKQGLAAETKKLTKQVGKKRLKEIGLAYPIVAEYLEEKITKPEMIERSVNSIYHYAKRQKTWFKRNKKIHWIKTYKQAEKLTKRFLK
ncbi:MAG: tRNA (adenosine(37)-N6)-dimethylallyltransferase MiaA [Candidatus Doudnabacteria bacterium CG10_big_fil_rev_8_21_14_0_10_41_10]|uniref:tRNA dimethylallyltransferase n=1 Tax=Candidatus Doudnabacteria bacterium CG10_big_fil_rev_8_21_14_0_10_41_10 TaxID=1974551 RepID=A0A2H0VCW9_9BACT|nr:MAG: tRNA (adenosine(37)-N6)-dimethylallyltransferase MiaA [Candidatus Doudnabacteria bacterium CG10_big_fil_rev_8_21_14_0_10_41_10]